MLFDCMVHTWTATEIQKMQNVLDNAYRWIWNHKRGLAKLRMQKEHVNAYEIRGQLGIASMLTKIATRTLSRIGHILCMPNERPTKRIILGTWDHEPDVRGGLKRGTLWYWRKLLGEAGIDWTNTENLSRNRKRWISLVKKRGRFLIDWAEKMRLTGKHDPKPPRAQSPEQTEKAEGFTCRWEGCTRVCRSKGGLTQH